MKITNNHRIECNLSSVWDILTEIRTAVEKVTKNIDANEVDFAKITASELCENAIKYGVQNSTADNMKFLFSYKDDIITIMVSNAISDVVHQENLKSFINMLNASDSHDLYIKRLYDLLDSRNPQVSQLGLLRIADVCRYKLTFDFNGQNVRVTATKDLKGKANE
ncbi:MAG: hypothetical protein JW874_15950 [Spirochaetales bacterium]|nr:hypothetical protein [Spirochaetales bacterium]